MVLNKASLCEVAKPKVIEVPINGSMLLVSEISQEKYESIIENPANKKGEEQNWHLTMTDFIIASVVNEDGSKMFNENDKELVNGFSREVRKSISDACLKANGFGGDEKNDSGAIKNASLIGESQLDLAIDTPTN